MAWVCHWMRPPTLGRISGMDALDREVATILEGALRGLVRYVDARTDEHTADDDVRALEDVADVLHHGSPEGQARLREICGRELAELLGPEEPPRQRSPGPRAR